MISKNVSWFRMIFWILLFLGFRDKSHCFSVKTQGGGFVKQVTKSTRPTHKKTMSRTITKQRTTSQLALQRAPGQPQMEDEASIATTTTTVLVKRKKTSPVLTQLQSTRSDDTDTDDNDTSLVKTQTGWLLALVLPLLLVYVSNQWTRSSIYYLVNFSDNADPFRSMNVDIGFSEAQYGLLASLAFTALFAIASLGAGIASDRFDRKNLTILSAVGWGVAALGTSLSSSYSQVLLWRIAMGLACAFTTPTAYTLINEKVPNDRVGFATSIYGTGVAFGGALASLSILLDNQVGWQQTMIIISCVAFAVAALTAVVVPDDEKKNNDNDRMEKSVAGISDSSSITENKKEQVVQSSSSSSSSIVDDVTMIFDIPRARWIFLGSFLRFCSGLCIGVWSAPYFRMMFPENASNYAVAQALITALAGSASGLVGGAAADWISTSNQQGKEEKEEIEKINNDVETDAIGNRLWVPVVGSILAAPAWYLAIHESNSFQIAMIWLSIEYFVAECWFGPTISSLLGTVPKTVGGTAQGMFTLTGGVANLAPTLLGFLYGNSGQQQASTELMNLLSIGVCLGYVSSAVCFGIGAKSSSLPSSSLSFQKEDKEG